MDLAVFILVLLLVSLLILEIKRKKTSQNHLYHGSSSEIDEYLEPRPSKVIDGEKAVFATDNKSLALVFIPKSTDKELGIGTVHGVPYVMEEFPGAFNLLKTPGYIYTVSKNGFLTDKRLGMKNNEFISRNKVKIINKSSIKNVYNELLSPNSDILFISYDQSVYFKKIHDIPQ